MREAGGVGVLSASRLQSGGGIAASGGTPDIKIMVSAEPAGFAAPKDETGDDARRLEAGAWRGPACPRRTAVRSSSSRRHRLERARGLARRGPTSSWRCATRPRVRWPPHLPGLDRGPAPPPGRLRLGADVSRRRLIEPQVDVLVNNAGVFALAERRAQDGFEMQVDTTT